MSVRVAIVGSRAYPLHPLRRTVFGFVAASLDIHVVSGGAPGPDTEARRAAQFYRRPLTIHPADWDRLGRGAGFARNSTIVADCDWVLAFHAKRSRGTADTIAKARKVGKRVETLTLPEVVGAR